ncbi:MAG: 3-phosphoglycerate dehydrogenase family protein [Oscillospiraceae bacterium]|jgi:D-3-phosphoglycerate dehydrogenase
MYRIQTLNKISPTGLALLDKSRYTIGNDLENPDGILVRSTDMQNYTFLPSLRAIARAGVGVNNIPIDRCSESGIVVFNTPGANANAVKELAVCALLLASRDILGGAEWVHQQAREGADVVTAVEKGKSAFVGPEISGKTLGVLGLGAVGVQVANIATKLGMTVYGYDPFLSVDSALRLSRSVHRAMDLNTIFKNCDYITLHMPLTPETNGMVNAESIQMMKSHVRILNLARSELVVDDDIIAALEEGKVASYITDFPNNKIVAAKNVVAIPHLGASSPESEENCAVMAVEQLKDYLENGNIRNSVNLPNVSMDRSGMIRMGIIHRNVPNMLASIMSVLSKEDINVENLMNHSKRNYAYTLVDLNSRVHDRVVDEVRAIGGVLRVRVIR